MLVSIVVPTYNNAKKLSVLLDMLEKQTFSSDSFEVIVVDNNSSDHTREVCRRYSVNYIFENVLQNSYRARNVGAGYAKGDILAFIDSDCCPARTWLGSAVEGILSDGADLTAGRVEFVYNKYSVSEIYDSIFCMQNERLVAFRGVATTASLLVKNAVFRSLGGFDERSKSGGDIEFTARASEKGFKLIYAKNAIVFHPARTFIELNRKMLRTASGKYYWSRRYSSTPGIKARMKGEGINILFNPIQIRKRMREVKQKSLLCFFRVYIMHVYFLIVGGIYQLKIRFDESEMV